MSLIDDECWEKLRNLNFEGIAFDYYASKEDVYETVLWLKNKGYGWSWCEDGKLIFKSKDHALECKLALGIKIGKGWFD